MDKLDRNDLLSLERYAELRTEFRDRMLKHKRHRRVSIGPHLHLYFEDRLTIQYQIQEMLRIEKIFEADAIDEELATYNPLIPDGCNLKATAMLEYQSVDERRRQLALLRGIEDLVWVQVDRFKRVHTVANEDLQRSNAEKTSAVHFMRFEFTAGMINALRSGAVLTFGSNHESYRFTTAVEADIHAALLADFA